MKKHVLILIALLGYSYAYSAIDMQAHQASDDGMAAYTKFESKQKAYYTGAYHYIQLILQDGQQLFGSLNTLMGNTSRIGQSSFSYNSLRNEYVNVDKDLNTAGNIIGYYDGRSFKGVWDSGSTWNREHTWPQSKGANQKIPMGHDMQSVRPARTDINGDRGNDAYGESSKYYDPNNVKINNPNYQSKNNGTYRGDCARVILYDYIVYGQMGNYKNNLYNGEAQLLSKLGNSGVFESIEILLKWHMQDPPSLTEMVRNDGAQDYQGNRNPFIDYPEFAIQILKDEVTTYTVTANQVMNPNYQLTTRHGFVTYLTTEEGHAQTVKVSGATADYDKATGRLTISNVTGPVSITTDTPNTIDDIFPTDQQDALSNISSDMARYYMAEGNLHLIGVNSLPVSILNMQGQMIYTNMCLTGDQTISLQQGAYILRIGNGAAKIIMY